jgi:hypothetical protein
MSSGIGSYATTATVYGRAAQDSYYQLNSPGLINGNVEITGNLKVDGTTELVGAVTCDAGLTADGLVSSDGTNKVVLAGQTIQALSNAGATTSLFLNGNLAGGGAPVVSPAGMTVGGAAVAATVPGLSVQTAAGRIAITAGSNFNQINSFDANAAAANLVIVAQGQPTQTNALTVSSLATSGKVGTAAAPITFGNQLGYSGVLRLSATTGSFIGQFPMPPGCSLASQIYLTQINLFGDVVPTNLSPPFCVVSAAGPTGFTVDIVQGQTTGVNVSMQCSYFIVV